MELSRLTLELLRDEAYILLCRETILTEMEARTRDKSSGQPAASAGAARSSKRGGLLASLFPAEDPDVALYSRLTRISRLASWLQQRLRVELSEHLEATHAGFKSGIRVQQTLNEWDFCVRHVLPDSLADFARELRGLRQTLADAERKGVPAAPPDFAALRRIAGRVEEQQIQVARIAAAVAGHAQAINAAEVLPPSLPNFRRLVWVDWLSVVPGEKLAAELTRIESELRTFLNRRHAEILETLQANRNACSARQEKILQEYWDRLRAHAQAHFVEELELDAVLDSLSHRYEPEIAQREHLRLRPIAPG